MQELISIAMATYNGEKYLVEQLNSIYMQTYPNIEVVVIDDLSRDKTVEILEEYKQKYGLIYIVNDINLGVTKNFEKAISMCNGEYIALVDQDDVWLPNKLEVLYANIGEYSLIYSNAEIIDEKSHRLKKTTKDIYPMYGLDSNSIDICKYLLLHSFILGCATMFKRELLAELIPVYETTRNHDWWLSICAYNHYGIKYIDEVLFYYRHHSSNYSIQKQETKFYRAIQYFSSKSKKTRYNKALELSNITKILSQKKYCRINEKVFLKDMKILCSSLLNNKLHFKAFYISWKYETYFFLNKRYYLRKINLFSQLFS